MDDLGTIETRNKDREEQLLAQQEQDRKDREATAALNAQHAK